MKGYIVLVCTSGWKCQKTWIACSQGRIQSYVNLDCLDYQNTIIEIYFPTNIKIMPGFAQTYPITISSNDLSEKMLQIFVLLSMKGKGFV